MPRGRSYGSDPYAAARQDLAERRFAHSIENDESRYSLSQESNLLRMEQMRFQAMEARQKIALERYKTAHASEIVAKMGALKETDPDYQLKRAKILADHAPGLDMAKDWVKQQDSVWEAQQKANQLRAEEFSPKNITDALEKANKILGQYKDNASVPQAVRDTVYNLQQIAKNTTFGTMNQTGGPTAAAPAPQDLVKAPAATAALNAVAQPATAQPAAQPVAIATQEATKFLQSIGVGAPPPAAQPTAQPVQAAQSGLPDAAEKSVSDEETP